MDYNMEEFIIKLPEYVQMIAQALGAISVIASVIVRLTPSKSDNVKVKKISDGIFKVISYLPTLGVNPKTKELEASYKELNK